VGEDDGLAEPYDTHQFRIGDIDVLAGLFRFADRIAGIQKLFPLAFGHLSIETDDRLLPGLRKCRRVRRSQVRIAPQEFSPPRAHKHIQLALRLAVTRLPLRIPAIRRDTAKRAIVSDLQSVIAGHLEPCREPFERLLLRRVCPGEDRRPGRLEHIHIAHWNEAPQIEVRGADRNIDRLVVEQGIAVGLVHTDPAIVIVVAAGHRPAHPVTSRKRREEIGGEVVIFGFIDRRGTACGDPVIDRRIESREIPRNHIPFGIAALEQQIAERA